MVIHVLYCCVHVITIDHREAAKAAGLWDTAPLLEEIAPEVMKKYKRFVLPWLLLCIYFFKHRLIVCVLCLKANQLG